MTPKGHSLFTQHFLCGRKIGKPRFGKVRDRKVRDSRRLRGRRVSWITDSSSPHEWFPEIMESRRLSQTFLSPTFRTFRIETPRGRWRTSSRHLPNPAHRSATPRTLQLVGQLSSASRCSINARQRANCGPVPHFSHFSSHHLPRSLLLFAESHSAMNRLRASSERR
jgi:hypothetical protein